MLNRRYFKGLWGFNCFFRGPTISTPVPGLSLSASNLTENSAQGTVIGTFTYPNATAPTAKTLSAVIPAGTLQLVGDQLQAGATAVDYEANTSISYTLTYTDGGTPYSFNRTVNVINIAAPANTGAPSITGTPEVGQALTGSNGAWSGGPSSYNYKWQRSANGTSGWADIAGATSASYTLQAADDLQYVRRGVSGVSVEGAGAYAFSVASAQITYTAPTAAGGLSDQTYIQGSGDQTVDAAPDFTGAVGGTWSIAGGGATINASGVVTIPTTALQTGTVITVTYTNSGGAASSAFQIDVTAAPTVPGAMAAPSFNTVTTTSFNVIRASAPSNGGSAITSYDMRHSTDEATWTTVTGISNPQALTGRAADTLYYVQTRAVNAVGNGPWGASGTVTTAAGDTTAPVSTAISYDSGTSTLTINITEAESLPVTAYWAWVASGVTPTEAQIVAGSGGSILEAGTLTGLTAGVNTPTITVTDAAGSELHFVLRDAVANSSGTPSVANKTVVTGITLPAAGLTAVGYQTATGTAATYTVPLTGLTGFDGGAGGDAQAGDLAICAIVIADAANKVTEVDGTASPGWTALEEAFQSSTRAANLGLAWKVLDASDISAGTVTVTGSNNAGRGGCAAVLIYSGPSVSPYKSKGTLASGTGDVTDPPALTTTIANSVVLTVEAATRALSDLTLGTPGAGATQIFTLLGFGSTRYAFLAMSFSKDNASGTTVNQGARTGTTNNSVDSWISQTIEVL